MSSDLLVALAISLALTLALEIGFFFLIGKRNKRDLLLVVMVNVLTNPVVVLLYWLVVLYTGWNTTIIKIPLEVFAILTEGFYFRKYGQNFKRPFVFSLAANMFSFWVGIFLQRLIF